MGATDGSFVDEDEYVVGGQVGQGNGVAVGTKAVNDRGDISIKPISTVLETKK